MENPPARVLIIDTAWLGDVIFSTSLIAAVSRTWPQAAVHVLVAPRGEPILRGNPQIKRLWVYDKHGIQKSAASLWKLGCELAAEKFDVVLNAHPSFRSRILTALTRAPIRIGYRGFLDHICLTHRVRNDLAVETDHAARRLALLKAIVPQAESAPIFVSILSEAKQWADNLLSEHKIEQRPLLALIVGSAWETKRWPMDQLASLAQRWIAEKKGSVIAVGGNAEAELIQGLCKQASGVIPLVNEPIPHVAALLARSTAVVGNDTGISFLGVAAGAPKVIVLFGCTQVDYHFPAPHQAITAGVPCCLPRTGHGSHRCRWGNEPWCMRQISGERVWNTLE